MELFTYICGEFKCVRCGNVTACCILTKVFQVSEENSSKEYRLGDVVSVDGLMDYVAIYPRKVGRPLRVVMGDWDCSVCSLNYQWAVVAFATLETNVENFPSFSAKIETIDTFIPQSPESFSGINFVENELAELATFSEEPKLNDRDSLMEGIDDRISAIISGHQRWLNYIRNL